jgi:hypothetical protein
MPDRYGDTPDTATTLDTYVDTVGDYLRRATHALTIGCRYCHAPKHEPCRNMITDQPHTRFLAHPIRITDAHQPRDPVPVPSPPPDTVPHPAVSGDGTPADYPDDFDEGLF